MISKTSYAREIAICRDGIEENEIGNVNLLRDVFFDSARS